MYHKHHTKGIVLKSYPDGESSLKIYLLTPDFGLVRAKVQSARKIDSKLRQGIQDYTLGQFSLVKGRNEWKIVGVSAEKNIYELYKKEREKILIIGNVFNLLKKLLGEEDERADVTSVVFGFIEHLKIIKKGDELRNLECLVLLKILNRLGYVRDDPELIPSISSDEILSADILLLGQNKLKAVFLINESLKASNLT